jgi:hypothetical protein
MKSWRPCVADELEALEKELAEYVDLRRRLGLADFRFVDALTWHRVQALTNLADSEDMMWADRIRLLDRLAERKGIPLTEERALRYVLDEIAERERRRRAEELDRRKEAAVRQETLT